MTQSQKEQGRKITKTQLELWIGQRRQQHMENLELWNNGTLIPTEPDEMECEAVKRELKAAIYELEEFAKEFDITL